MSCNTKSTATTYRLQSSGMVHMPGLVAWAINGYAFDKDREHILKVFTSSFSSVPVSALRQLLSKEAPYSVEDEAVVFTDQPPSEHEAEGGQAR